MASDGNLRRVLDVRTIDEPPFGPITDALEERGFDYETLRVVQQEWRLHVTHGDSTVEPAVEA